jgi:protein-S-isoprenylcysteine O-methyltransferase Ste14
MKKLKVFLIVLLSAFILLGLSILAFGGWNVYFSHRFLIALAMITLALTLVSLFTEGNLNSGQKEDRKNRWVFIAFSLIGLGVAIVPAYMDRLGIGIINGQAIPWIGIILYTSGCILRIGPVFVLKERFSGLVAIQNNHTLETQGIYGLVRNPSYLGIIISIFGWGLVFYNWFGIFMAFIVLIPIVSRIKSEEQLLKDYFGSQYEDYVLHTWRLFPWIY